MAATARITILMDHAQKTDLTRRAQAAGMSVGEYIRGKALDLDGTEALLDAVRTSTARASAALDRALAALEASGEHDAEREAAVRARARREFSNLDFDALAAWLDRAPAPMSSNDFLRLHVAEPRKPYP